MKFHGKSLQEYWEVFKLPFYALLVWYLATLVSAVFFVDLYFSLFASWAGFVIVVLAFGFTGWTAVKDHKWDIKQGAIAGALLGVLLGIVGGVMGIVIMFAAPAVIEESIDQAVAQGAPADMARKFVTLGIYLGVVIGPIWDAILGGILGALGAFIGKKF